MNCFIVCLLHVDCRLICCCICWIWDRVVTGEEITVMTNIVTTESGEKFTLFFTIRSPFSNFHPCRFTVLEDVGNGKPEERWYYSTEQYYMLVFFFHQSKLKDFWNELVWISTFDFAVFNWIHRELEGCTRKIQLLKNSLYVYVFCMKSGWCHGKSILKGYKIAATETYLFD